MNLKSFFLFFTILLFSSGLLAQNNALDFDGTNDYVTTSQFVNLSFQSFAIEGWFKADVLPTSGNYPHIFGVMEAGSDAALVRINGDSKKLEFVMNSSAGLKWVTSSETIVAGIWYHAAILYHKAGLNDNQYLLINGEVVASQSFLTVNNYSNQIFRIGGDGNRNFDGQVDDVKVWSNISRSSQDVRASMYEEVIGNESNLIAYYNLDETSGSSANDSQSSSTYDGTLTNMTGNEWTTSSAFFGPKNCLNFDGNDDNVWCPSISPTVTSGSIEFWVNLDVIPADNARLISRHSSYGYDEIYLLNNDGRIYTAGSFVVGDDLQSTNPLPLDVWTHVAITADGSGSKLYINGILDDTGGAAAWSFNTFRFGGQFTQGFWECIDGMMDEVRLWNDVRTEPEIRKNMFKSLVGNESNLVAYYNLDNKSGTVAQSYPAEANDGSIGGGPAWVTSTAFNTWLNTDDSSWSNASNWSDGVPVSTDNVGIVNYSGGASPTLSGTPTVNNLVVGSSANLSLSSNLIVNGNLFLYDDVDLNGQTITLGSSATLYEDSGNLFGTSGTITTIRNLSGITAENVAGLGAEITTTANMGSTTIIRGHQPQGGNGINRYYQINPTSSSGLDATLVFNYLDSELNGLTEENMKLFKSPTGEEWTVQSSSSVNSTDNTITLSGIDSFSWWTAGDADASLPVTLSSFTAIYLGGNAELQWTTQSESNNLGWNIYRSQNGEAENAMILNYELIAGAGTSLDPTNYSFSDINELMENMTYYYWIEDVTYGNVTNLHGPVSVTTTENGEDPNAPEIGQETKIHNYPNPFNPRTQIHFSLKENEVAEKIEIYNAKGQRIYTAGKPTTPHSWNGRDSSGNEVASGIYMYKLTTNRKSYIKKMVLSK